MGKIFVVGTGPGSRDYLTPAAVRAVGKAQVLVGGKRALSLFDSDKQKKIIDHDMARVVKYLEENKDKDIAVLTSGDPGFYSILTKLSQELQDRDIEVVPGVSSMQLCFARVKESWSKAVFLSAHGRDVADILRDVNREETMVFLTDDDSSPQRIAESLIRDGLGGKRAVVGEDLGMGSERIVDSTLDEVANGAFKGNSVMVVFHG